jgi:hypothetical protein
LGIADLGLGVRGLASRARCVAIAPNKANLPLSATSRAAVLWPATAGRGFEGARCAIQDARYKIRANRVDRMQNKPNLPRFRVKNEGVVKNKANLPVR